LALLTAAGLAAPAAASTALGDYFQETWSTADGLPHNQVLDIEQSADGYLWLGTWEGAARFNGHEFELLDAARLPEATEPAATELALRADGTPLIGTARGELLHLAAGRWQRSREAEGGRSLPIYSLLVLDDQHLVGTAGSGLWQQQGEQPLRPLQGSVVPDRGIVYALAADASSDTLWVGTDRGLFRRRAGVWSVPEQIQGLPQDGVLSLALGADRSLVVGTVTGAYRVEDGRAAPLHADLPLDSFESLLVDRRGNVWLGSANRGLFRVGERGVESLSAEQGLPSNRVVSLFEDREGSLWAGTSRGLFRLREAPFLSITQRQGLADVYTRTLLELPDGRVLAGTSSGIALIARGATGDRVVSQALQQESVLSAVRASDGSLWIGTYYNGLLQYAEERVQRRLSVADGLPSVQVRALLADPDGLLQIGTSRGLARWDGKRIEVFSAADGLPSESIISLHRDRRGQLWVGTGAGIALQRGTRFAPIDPALLDGALRIYGITEDAEQRIFIAHDRGLSMLEDGGWHSLGARQGLPIGSVFALRFDAAGDFWLSANRGVLRIDRSAALAALRGQAALRGWELFGEADGMVSAQCNGAAGLPALADSQGRLWFATAGGVVHVDPVRLAQFSRVEPQVRIEQLRIDGRVLQPSAEVVVPAAAQRIDLRYVGLNFQVPKKIRYRYLLEGFDADWVEAETQRSVQFTNLAPGAYRLRIQAANPAGDWNPQEASLRLRVEPWWWERGEFQWAAALLATLLLALAVRWRLRLLEAQRVELQRRVDRATADLQRQAAVLQEQNVELDAYAHSVAHDLKNPLATVIGMSSLVRSIGQSMPEAQRLDMLGRIHAAGLKMVEIIDALLLLSRARSDSEVALQAVPLRPLIEETLKGLSTLVSAAGAEVEIELQQSAVTGYAPWIERVLSNYLANAVKYGGEPPRIQVGSALRDAMVEVWVQDFGAGMSAEAQQRLFQPFSRAGRVGGDGHGLGLSIVRRIVERMGGSVGCESRSGAGTRFWFRLPPARLPWGGV
jgi:ligand-binding sensor domain-containing protein